ncbi:hypothetical protein PQ465_09690 [Sphingobacterium oryzagri]|uniref:Tetratricopeptide repeat protein n=1 Tax=Sphingobacterium oryzagri TaxID=3025669 RepID=A0ABY7WQ00_9SPHI|nr:tetratricopeptide repeat protein [Sphingobacterium sp. KACC 22765]WDF70629.1 hypothetical protein PQ465_09690 [Sphingobacterium sp. KACC 22765]
MDIEKNRYFQLASAQLFPYHGTAAATVLDSDKQDEDEAVRLARQAFAYVIAGDDERALTCYTEGISRFPEQAFFHACRSILNTKLSDQEGAFYDYQVAKSIDFNYHIFLEWHENKPEVSTIDPAVGYNDLQSLLESALDATQQFDYEHALTLYAQAVSAFPDSADVLVYQGALHMRLLRYDLAYENFKAALLLAPDHFQAYVSLGKFYQAIHDYAAAQKAFDAAATISPENSVIYEERGNFLIERKAYTAALSDLDKLVELLPDDFYVYAIRADLLDKMDAWMRALADYSKAIQLNPYYSDLYTYRAEIKEKLGDLEGAAADRRLYEEIEAED